MKKEVGGGDYNVVKKEYDKVYREIRMNYANQLNEQ